MNAISERLREPATIRSVSYGKEDHGILTCWLHLSLPGSVQGFGGLALGKLGPDFAAAVCGLFGVTFTTPEESLNLLEGKRCWALRCFEEWDAGIEGLEVESGERFLLTNWRRRYCPETLDPLAEATRRIRSEIAWARRRLAEEQDKLSTVVARYHDWSGGSS